MPAVCVFLSSSAGSPDDADAIAGLARALAARRWDLVYGGARNGLMGVLGDAMVDAGGRAIGVIPTVLVGKELAHDRLSAQHVVDNMHQRKQLMFELADAFIVAPGGFGTLEEAFEVLTGVQIGVHAKPVVFL